VDARTGYVVGDSSVILKTTDGGANWAGQKSGDTLNGFRPPRTLRSVHFPVDAQTGWVVGWTGTIFKTTDGGAHWLSQSYGSADLFSVQFPADAQTGYAVGDLGKIYNTKDGGTGVEETVGCRQKAVVGIKAKPNPFTSFAALPGHEAERFSLYDISGKRVGVYRGDRVGEGLAPGVYFLRPSAGNARPARMVKLR
jgi:photosystem II stability/assembly factor-like uncharacterized protein